uniref:Uncharacterized protein n=1 Tax=Vespula pensylvanica TaxID=30213 RepID=A0A834JSX3_VESPE|nr:hypothetical protein H0235_016758 [Vespula pensylvanica]
MVKSCYFGTAKSPSPSSSPSSSSSEEEKGLRKRGQGRVIKGNYNKVVALRSMALAPDLTTPSLSRKTMERREGLTQFARKTN